MTISEPETLTPERFIRDVKRTCTAVDTLFSEDTTRAVIKAYSRSFLDGAVLWSVTNREGDALNLRSYERPQIGTFAIAVQAGLLEPNNLLARLVTVRGSLYDGTPERSCDLDAEKGLTRAWIYMGGFRPLDDIFDARGVLEPIRRHGHTFYKLGLETVRHVVGDYHSDTVNLYFRAPGPVMEKQAARFVKLAGCPPPSREEFNQMREFLCPTGFTFVVTPTFSTGAIKCVSFYALKLPPDTIREVGERRKTFFEQALSYDREETNAVAWSFGIEGKKYIKAERSYCGRLVPLLRD